MLQAPQLLLPGNSVAESADCPWGDDPTSLGSEGGNTVTQTDLQQQLVDLQLQQHQQQQVLPAHMQAMAAAFTGLTSAGSSSSNAGLLQELLSGMPGDAAAAAAASIMQSCGGSCSVEAELQLHQGGLERLACFIEANARVTGLSLAHNALGPWGAQVGSTVGLGPSRCSAVLWKQPEWLAPACTCNSLP